MTKYKITEEKQGLRIEITEMAGNEQELLSEFEKCQQGRCSCLTDEYKKLDSIALERQEDGIQIQLTTKEDQKLEKEEIIKCLGHTIEISKPGE